MKSSTLSTMPKNAPEKHAPSPVSSSDLFAELEKSLRLELNKGQQFCRSIEDQLRKIAEIRGGEPSQERPTTGLFRYVNMRVSDAIFAYLERTQRPWTREELVGEVIDGGVYVGKGDEAKGDAVVQVNKSIDYFLKTPEEKLAFYEEQVRQGKKKKKQPSVKPARLRQVGELIGLTEWPDEKFQVE